MNHFSNLEQRPFRRGGRFFSRTFFSLRLLAIVITCALFGGMPAASAQEKIPEPVRHFLNSLQKRLNMEANAKIIQKIPEGYELYYITFSDSKENKEKSSNRKSFISDAFILRAILKGVSRSDSYTSFDHIKLEQVNYQIKSPNGKIAMITIPKEDKFNVSILHSNSAKSPQEKRMSGTMLVEKSIIPRIDILWANGFSLTLHDVRQAWKGNRRTGEGATEAGLGSLVIPARELAFLDPAISAWLEMLGLEKVKLSVMIRSQNQWKSDQRLHFNARMHLRLENAGTLEFELNDLAFPVALMNLLEDQKASGNATAASQSSMPLTLNNPQVSSALNQLTLQRVRIKWKDAGLTRRYLALKNSGALKGLSVPGTRGAENVQSLDVILRNVLGEPYQRASDAFQKNPENFQIDIRGRNGSPISAPMLIALALVPQGLASMLQIDIRANMPE